MASQFTKIFAVSALQRGYITQVVRQAPYTTPLPIVSPKWHKIASKNTYAITLSRFRSAQDYLEAASKSQKRAIKRAKRANLQFRINNFMYDWEDDSPSQKLIKIYLSTIQCITTNTAYQFTDAYFSHLGALSRRYPGSVQLAEVFIEADYNKSNPIAAAIIFAWPISDGPSYIHYHLGGYKQEYADQSPMNFLYYKVMKYYLDIVDPHKRPQLFHLGGGITTGDSLEQLHAKIIPEHQLPLTYTIYGEVFNPDIYQKLEDEYLQSSSRSRSPIPMSSATLSYRRRAKKYKYFPIYKENDQGI